MGEQLPDGGKRMVRRQVHEMSYKRPSCDAIVSYMLGFGLDFDVHVEQIMHDNGIALVGSGGLGAYSGRVNRNEGRKKTGLRLVPGKLPNTYRLIKLA